MSVCEQCAARSALLAELAGAIERLRLDRWELIGLLALSDEQLIDAVRAKTMRAIGASRRSSAGVCRHDPRYPARLAELECAPAALHIAAERPERLLDLLARPVVAIVGSREKRLGSGKLKCSQREPKCSVGAHCGRRLGSR